MSNQSTHTSWLPLALHVVLLTSAFVWAGTRFTDRHAELWERPPFRNEPITILPLYDDPDVINDDQLARVLWTLRPQLRQPHEKINHIDHALRMWGPAATFDDPNCLSGLEMLEILLDERKFRMHQGQDATELLKRGKYGVLVNVAKGSSTSSHVDHTLAGLGEIGVPLDYPVVLEEGEVELSELLRSAIENFSLNQAEYEWSTLAFAEYLAPHDGWFTQEGQKITYDLLAERIMRQRLVQGVCRGNHRLHALTMLLRIDDLEPILSDETRTEIVAHLRNVTDRLIANQHAEGFWDYTWPGVERDGPQPATGEGDLAQQTDRFLVTGHTLEWWSLAPESLQPPREVVTNAAQWLVREILALTPGELKANYTFLTHAGRALALWRGRFPHEVDLSSLR